MIGLRNSILHDILQFLNLQDGKKRLLSVNQFDPIPAFVFGGGVNYLHTNIIFYPYFAKHLSYLDIKHGIKRECILVF